MANRLLFCKLPLKLGVLLFGDGVAGAIIRNPSQTLATLVPSGSLAHGFVQSGVLDPGDAVLSLVGGLGSILAGHLPSPVPLLAWLCAP